MNELQHLAALRGSDHILQIFEFFRYRHFYVIVTPYYEHDSFEACRSQLDEQGIKLYMHSLFKALEAIHKKGILHRDIKPGNFLYSIAKRRGILIDFGLAESQSRWEPGVTAMQTLMNNKRKLQRARTNKNAAKTSQAKGARSRKRKLHSTSYSFKNKKPARGSRQRPGFRPMELVASGASTQPKTSADRWCPKCCQPACPGRAARSGTPGYRAPEVLMRCINQTTAVDVWAAGVVFLSLLTRQYPFFGQSGKIKRGVTSEREQDLVSLAQILALCGGRSESTDVVRSSSGRARNATASTCRSYAFARDCFKVLHCRGISSPRSLADFAKDMCAVPHMDNHAFTLLQSCLDLNPKSRISATEALRHPFFRDL